MRYFVTSASDLNLIDSLHEAKINICVYNCASNFTTKVKELYPKAKILKNDEISEIVTNIESFALSVEERGFIAKHMHNIIQIVERYEYSPLSFSEVMSSIDKLFFYYLKEIKGNKISRTLMGNTPHTLDSYLIFMASIWSDIDIFVLKVTSLEGVHRLEKIIFTGETYLEWGDPELLKVDRSTDEHLEILKKIHDYSERIYNKSMHPDNFYRFEKIFGKYKIIKALANSSFVLYILKSFIRPVIKNTDLVNKHRGLSKVDHTPWLSHPKNRYLYALNFFRQEYRLMSRQKKVIKKYDQLSHNYKTPDKYIFFPLQMQPEVTTTPLGGLYSTHIRCINHLLELIPKDFHIVIKEHSYQHDLNFSMARLGRKSEDYDILNSSPRVLFAPMGEETRDLILKSNGVSVITSSVGFESICLKKPVLIFGFPWWHVQGFNYHIFDNASTKSFVNDIMKGKTLQNNEGFFVKLSQYLFKGEFADLGSHKKMSNSETSFLNNE